jgi:hypothetical protein
MSAKTPAPRLARALLYASVLMAFRLIAVGSLLVPGAAYARPQVASAEDSAAFDHHVAVPENNVEVAVATGYTRGAGPLADNGGHLEDIAGPGGAVALAAAYRIDPTFSVGAYGTFSKYNNGDPMADVHTDVLGATAGIEGIVHLRPARSIDPWVSLGTGWKGLWRNEPSGRNTALQGLELARLQLGVDYRVSPEISLAPIVGGSLGMYLGEDSPMTTGYSEISDKRVNVTGFAGIAGRFDLGAKR